jgi:hypothetical protein
MQNTDPHIDLERSKANFAFWYDNRFSKKPDAYIQKEMKCTCGQSFYRIEQGVVIIKGLPLLWDFKEGGYILLTVSIPKRFLTRYVDFENKTADTCFSCGKNLELVANLIQKQKYLKKERNQLTKRLKEIDLKLNTQK